MSGGSGLDSVRALETALKAGEVFTRARDVETADHDARVSRVARLVGRTVAPIWNLPDRVVEVIALFAAAHDLGKVAVPDTILGKHGPLDARETRLMQTHTTAGAAIIDGIVRGLGIEDHEHLSILRTVVRSHHELLDGSGYPDGLRGDEIPPEARIVAVADVYDALTSPRPYKEAWSHADALAFLTSGRGTRFDPVCVDALLANASALEAIRSSLEVGSAPR
jgi:HD-GYP domain-containing protein (c-di-GMP phosphodiesterase class II)